MPQSLYSDSQYSHRLWWRDTRLTELAQSTPPAIPSTSSQSNAHTQYQFPYPTTFLPIPYHTDTTLHALSNHVIPFARSSRSVNIDVPAPEELPAEGTMEVDTTFRLKSAPVTVSTSVSSDGLLLYVAEACYEAGTSPLSSWIPIASYSTSDGHPGDNNPITDQEGPLDVFQR